MQKRQTVLSEGDVDNEKKKKKKEKKLLERKSVFKLAGKLPRKERKLQGFWQEQVYLQTRATLSWQSPCLPE